MIHVFARKSADTSGYSTSSLLPENVQASTSENDPDRTRMEVFGRKAESEQYRGPAHVQQFSALIAETLAENRGEYTDRDIQDAADADFEKAVAETIPLEAQMKAFFQPCPGSHLATTSPVFDAGSGSTTKKPSATPGSSTAAGWKPLALITFSLSLLQSTVF